MVELGEKSNLNGKSMPSKWELKKEGGCALVLAPSL